MTQNRVQWQDHVNMVMKFQFPVKTGNFLSTSATVGFSGRTEISSEAYLQCLVLRRFEIDISWRRFTCWWLCCANIPRSREFSILVK